MKISKTNLLLFLILLSGALLRFISLSSLPAPLNGDEAAFGYYSWSIANFATDEYLNKLPVYFPSIGDYKYPAYVYLGTPFAKVFGLSEFMPRALSALSGVFLIFVIYKLSRLLFKKESIALVSAAVLAVNPWHILFSRTASESNLSLFLITCGVYFLLKYLFEKTLSKKPLYISFVLFFLAIYSYSAARVFVPSFLITLFILLVVFHSKEKTFKEIATAKRAVLGIFCLVFVAATAVSLIPWQSRARAENVSVFSNSSVRDAWRVWYIEAAGKGDAPLPVFITRAYFNKVSGLFWEISSKYVSHFSTDYLFLKGDPVQLNSVPNTGNFYLIEAVFLVVGMALLISKPGLRESIILSIILLSPLAASLSTETPSAVRQLAGLSGFVLAISYGAWKVSSIKPKVVVPFLGIVYFFLVSFFLVNLFKIKSTERPWTTDQGVREMVKFVWENRGSYESVAMPKSPYIHFLFYEGIPPADFSANSEILPESRGLWGRVERFENIFFKMDVPCPKIGKEKVLYVCTGLEVPRAAKVLEVIRFDDFVPAYVLVEFERLPQNRQASRPLPNGLNYMVEGDGRYPFGVLEEEEERLW